MGVLMTDLERLSPSTSETQRTLTFEHDPALRPASFRATRSGNDITFRVADQKGMARASARALVVLHRLSQSDRLTEAEATYFLRDDLLDLKPFRGVLIDVARRYHSIETLKHLIKTCQLADMNIMVLHLTDDQNWMLPTDTLLGIDRLNTHGKPAYTKSEIRDLVEYAQLCGVDLVPEIDTPGHSTLLVKHDPKTFTIQGSATTNCINFASEPARTKLKALWKETLELFPDAPYVHIGGDEAWYPDAMADPHFKAAIGPLGDTQGLDPAQSVFIDFIADLADYLRTDNRQVLVWEGFHQTPYAKRLLDKVVVINWGEHVFRPTPMLADGYTIVNACWNPGYVVGHYPQDAITAAPLERIWDWHVLKSGRYDTHETELLTARNQVVGGLMCWWEGRDDQAIGMLEDRMVIYGSRLTLEPRSSNAAQRDFARRRINVLRDLRGGLPSGTNINLRPGDKHALTLRPELSYHYTTDGSDPTTSSPRLTAETQFDASGTVLVRPARNGRLFGPVSSLYINKVEAPTSKQIRLRADSPTAGWDAENIPLLFDRVVNDRLQNWVGRVGDPDTVFHLEPVELRQIVVRPYWDGNAATRYRLTVVATDGTEHVIDMSQNTVVATPEGHVHDLPRSLTVARLILKPLGTDKYPSAFTRLVEIEGR